MKLKRIVLTGAPGTGKTTTINYLKEKGFYCFEEISRDIIRGFQSKGISNPFISNPNLFNKQIFQERIKQFNNIKKEYQSPIFYDRGIHDVVAYMEYANTPIPYEYKIACQKFKYDLLFIFPPWKEIYNTDSERFESFEQACNLHKALLKVYAKYNYSPIEVPKSSVTSRIQFITDTLQCL